MPYTVEDALLKLSTAPTTPEWVPGAVEQLKSLPPALVDPSEVAVAVWPYRWFLARVEESGPAGLKLTSAGLLRPADVTAVMVELGWQRHWIGKHNRESQTQPAAWLRESAMALRLVRTAKGSLVLTKKGRSVKDDPMALWAHIGATLPVDRADVDLVASVARLLWAATAPADKTQSGEASVRDAIGAVVRRSDGGDLTSMDIRWLGERTEHVMRVLGGIREGMPSELERALAISCLRGRYGALIATWALQEGLGLDARAAISAMMERIQTAVAAAAPAAPSDAPTAADTDSPGEVSCHILKVTLRRVKPPVWRRVRVSSSLTLPQVAWVLMAAMGWQGYHLWQFRKGQTRYLPPDPDWPDPRDRDAADYTLEQLLPKVGDRVVFDYDFGDGWEHDVVVEKRQLGDREPGVLAGRRNCPPEDVGGPGGYTEFLEALSDPRHSDHQMMLEWSGGGFDPEEFDVAECDERVEGSQYPPLPW